MYAEMEVGWVAENRDGEGEREEGTEVGARQSKPPPILSGNTRTRTTTHLALALCGVSECGGAPLGGSNAEVEGGR